MHYYREIAGGISVILSLTGYIMYAAGIVRKRTKPHAFSWLAWGMMNGVIFAVQIVKGAGPGSWSMALGTIGCLSNGILALKFGKYRFDRLDWLAFSSVVVAIALWTITKQPLVAALLITLGDAIGFVPSFRKGFVKPFEEHLAPFTIGALISIFAIAGLASFDPANWIYLVSLILTNMAYVIMVSTRRRHVPVNQTT